LPAVRQICECSKATANAIGRLACRQPSRDARSRRWLLAQLQCAILPLDGPFSIEPAANSSIGRGHVLLTTESAFVDYIIGKKDRIESEVVKKDDDDD